MKNFHYCVKYKKLKNLETILAQWIKIHKSFCSRFEDDSLYWHNERASISTLAGAVWKCGEVCLEEYGALKMKHKNNFIGRADLWFTQGNKEYYVEAKKIEISLSEKAYSSTKKITEKLKAARDDAARIKKMGEGQALGIVFASPYLALSEFEKMNKRLNIFIDEIEQIEYDFLAYAFPPNCRTLEHGKYFFPGVVLIGRVPKH